MTAACRCGQDKSQGQSCRESRCSRRAESVASAFGSFAGLRHVPVQRSHGCDDHLGDPVAVANVERPVAVVDQNDVDFSAIVGVDRSWSVQDRHTVPVRKTRPRPDLRFETPRQRDPDSAGNHPVLARIQGNAGETG